MAQHPLSAIRVRMRARDRAEPHRVSSPLELLFDLTFVVAIAQVAAQLAHSIAEGHELSSVFPYLMAFFAIWWAWMNFTWFASAYDTDDVPYRLLTMLQMGGVLTLAAGVGPAVADQDYRTITIGYAIMRVALAAQWLRAGIEHPEGRKTAIRYAGAVVVVQLLWWSRLLLPDPFGIIFLVLAAMELSIPPWAERTGRTNWHPHHIAERYGLFTIILLGESVLAATAGVQGSVNTGDAGWPLIGIAVSGLVLLFALWWLYFLEPAGGGLEAKRHLSFLWGYGHYGIFASLAAIGAALEVAVEMAGHHTEVSASAVGLALAVPVAVFLGLLWGLNAPLLERNAIRPVVILPAAALVVFVGLAADALGVIAAVALIALLCAAVVAVTLLKQARAAHA
ncbi:MAG: low temperature requirement protein A [Rhodoglobus sp.]